MRRRLIATSLAIGLTLTACGGDDDAASDDAASDDASSDMPSSDDAGAGDSSSGGSSASSETTDDSADASTDGGGEPIDEERCATNRDAGTVTFLTSFDYAAAASIIDVIVAQERGYYEAMCLDVEITPSLSTENYPLIASGTAQFSSGGSFAEVASFAVANDADFDVVMVDGNVPIDVLMVKDGIADGPADLADTTIGVQGRTPMSIAAMLAGAGLTDNEDFTSVPLAGFDAAANIAPDDIAGITGYKSNEVGQLDAAGIAVDLFDPAAYNVPGSFGVVYTSAEYHAQHPTVVEDFTRATLRGLEDAMAEPNESAQLALALAEESGNAFFLSIDGETFRWTTEAELVASSRIEGQPLGYPNVDSLQGELDAYAPFGLFGDGDTPEAANLVDATVIDAIHDDTGTLAWPS